MTDAAPLERPPSAIRGQDSPDRPPLGVIRAESRFLRAAIGTIVATVFVILFGAVVRITGSGAGCGQHWPTCQGEVAHLPRSVETLIELTHRLTSGLLGLVVFGLLIWALRVFPRGRGVRLWASLSTVFILTEALIGMLLVRLALVGDDASIARAVVMPLHLVNTSVLLAAMTLTAFFACPARALQSAANRRGAAIVCAGLLGVLIVSGSGAVTALGDTVYRASSDRALAHLTNLEGEALHFLERARALHPLLAVLTVGLLLIVLPRVAETGSSAAHQLVRAGIGLLLIQTAAGGLNVLLSAPGWMQVVHLLLSCTIWIGLVLLAAELWTPRLPEGWPFTAAPRARLSTANPPRRA